jgi:O-antigen/teichoic acid export membrane protein
VTTAAAATTAYGRGARTVSAGIAATGLLTVAYFALSSHTLDGPDYSLLAVLWSVLFVVITVAYRPIEQLLSRTIAHRASRGLGSHPLRTIAAIEAGLAAMATGGALILRPTLQERLFDGSAALSWILVAAIACYAASYFARGWLSGHKRFGLYGLLVLVESATRLMFAVAVAAGLAGGVDTVALGMAAAPMLSLIVVPLAFARRQLAAPAPVAEDDDGGFTLAHGVGFAAGVLGVTLAEQALLNAPVLVVNAQAHDAALAGVVFNVFLIVRAPLVLFQSVQTSLLPHLAGLDSAERAFGHAVRTTLVAIAAFAGATAAGLLIAGPAVLGALFGGDGDYARGGLALVGLAMGFHLAAVTLTQAQLARGRTAGAAAVWLAAAAGFVVWMSLGPGDLVLRAEAGYLGATAVLFGAVALLERRSRAAPAAGPGAPGAEPGRRDQPPAAAR